MKMRFSKKAYKDWDIKGREYTKQALESIGIVAFNKDTYQAGTLAYKEILDKKRSKQEREQDKIEGKIEKPDFILTADGKTFLCGLEATIKVGWNNINDFYNDSICTYFSRRIKYMKHKFPVGIVTWSKDGKLSFHVWLDKTNPSIGCWVETSRNVGKEEYFPKFTHDQASICWKSQEYLIKLPKKQKYNPTWDSLRFLLK